MVVLIMFNYDNIVRELTANFTHFERRILVDNKWSLQWAELEQYQKSFYRKTW